MTNERVRFSEFVLDVRTRELLHGDDQVALSPKAFQLLEILVLNRPKALSKSDLQNRLWPDTFVVEKNLANRSARFEKGSTTMRRTHGSSGPCLDSATRFWRCRTNRDTIAQGHSTRIGTHASVWSGAEDASRSTTGSTFWAAIPISSSSSTRPPSPGVTRS